MLLINIHPPVVTRIHSQGVGVYPSDQNFLIDKYG